MPGISFAPKDLPPVALSGWRPEYHHLLTPSSHFPKSVYILRSKVSRLPLIFGYLHYTYMGAWRAGFHLRFLYPRVACGLLVHELWL